MNEVRRREPLEYAGPGMEPVGVDPAHSWILSSFAFVFMVGEIVFLVLSFASIISGVDPILIFCLFFASAILASLCGLFGFRHARVSGSVGARGFAIFVLIGTALGLGGMLAVIFIGAR